MLFWTDLNGLPLPLDLHKRLASARLPQEKTIIERRILASGRLTPGIGLTEEEIRIVEEAAK